MKKLNLLILTLLAFTAVTFTSCVDQDFDDLTTANVDPDITPTHTIRQLASLATGTIGKEITSDVIIMGTVVGDDSTGNIYKTLVLQQNDSMGPTGVSIQVDVSNFYTEYPVGRHVFVNCKGLFVANNGGNIELGNSPTNPVGRIPSALLTKYLVKGKWGQYLSPTVYTLDDPNIPTNTLVKFQNVQFALSAAGIAYAQGSSSNLDIEACDSSTLVLYSSSYSTFALTKTPYGNGSIVGVYTVYNNSGELQIRDLRDVNMTALRCDGSTGVPDHMQLDSIRMLDNGATTFLPLNKTITVVVTSNYATGMLTTYSAYVQDNTAGIQIHIKFPNQHTFAIGTKLEINVSGLELSTYNGVLQINNVPLANCVPVGSGSVTPRVATISDIIAYYDIWESQVVQIDSVTISGTGTYNGASGVNTLDDGTGTITLYTGSGATFKNDPYPTGKVSITGILTEFSGSKEILIRDPAIDVVQ